MDIISINVAINQTLLKLRDDGIDALILNGDDGRQYELVAKNGALEISVKGGDSGPVTCPVCKGAGQVCHACHAPATQSEIDMGMTSCASWPEPCSVCHGTGQIDAETAATICPDCNCAGYVCTVCGSPAHFNKDGGSGKCDACGSTAVKVCDTCSEICDECGGTGKYCMACGGKTDENGICMSCGGSVTEDCWKCHGMGKIAKVL